MKKMNADGEQKVTADTIYGDDDDDENTRRFLFIYMFYFRGKQISMRKQEIL